MTLKASIIKNISYLRFLFYHKVFLPCLVWNKRRKDKIRILFVLQYLAEWKTELLYLEMKKHPRIEPIIGIIPCLEMSGEENKLKEYCKDKGYDYLSLDPEKTLVSQVQPDFIIHQKPYVHLIYEKHLIINNISVPCIMLPYGIHTTLEAYGINSYLSLRSWRHFYENQSTLDAHKKVHRLRGINFRVTGLPFLDTLIQPSDQFPDPWQDKKGRKRIIYAPHHTVPPLFKKGYNFSTFIENGEKFISTSDDKKIKNFPEAEKYLYFNLNSVSNMIKYINQNDKYNIGTQKSQEENMKIKYISCSNLTLYFIINLSGFGVKKRQMHIMPHGEMRLTAT